LSRAILENIIGTIDGFISGQCEIAELQGRLEADASALGRSHYELVNELQRLDADLEEIRFARLRDEQRPAAVLRLDPVRESALEALGKCND
jgi:hypothetical protein